MGKIFTVKMPDIGEGVVEGEVISWLKQPNDPLKQDEPVVVVMTDKATVELPAPMPGRLAKQYYQVGQTAIKDKPLYDIEVEEEIPAKTSTETKPSKKPPPIELPKKATAESHKALAAPPARKLAQELGVDINQIKGSGPEGRVTKEDVTHYVQTTSKEKSLSLLGDTEMPLIGIRKLMAKKMSLSKQMIPHFSYFEQVDATRLVQLKQSFKEKAAQQGVTVTFMPFIIRALSMTLSKYPIVNSSVDTEKNVIVMHAQHNVGIAITTEQGLIVPVLKNVEGMTLQELILAYESLKARALSSKLSSNDMKESTITISNFGVLGGGGLWATPIINYPEAAILALARIQKLPLVRNDTIVVRNSLNLSWSFDHRIIDGDLAAAFSHHFSTLLQNPAALL